MRFIATAALLVLGCGLPPLDPRPETSDGGADAGQTDVAPELTGHDAGGDAAACSGTGDCDPTQHRECAPMGGARVYPTCYSGHWVCPTGTLIDAGTPSG